MVGEVEPNRLEIELVDEPARIVHPILRQIYLYWKSKCNYKVCPARADLDPTELPALLPHVLLIDVRREPFDLVIRLAGTQVVRGIGREITGLRLHDVPVSDAATLFEAYARVARDSRPRRIHGSCFIPPDRWPMVDRIVMPLASDGRTPDMLFAGVCYRASSGDTPPWLELAGE